MEIQMSRKSAELSSNGGALYFIELYKYFSQSLRKAFVENNLGILKSDYDLFKDNNGAEKKSALDQSFRELLLRELIADIENIKKLIGLSIEAARVDMVSLTIPVVLLSDAFDAVALDKCEQIFSFVEDKVSVWKEDWFFTSCKNNLLRMCNDLLRRLSRSQNTVFCGRILLFLAKFFPLSERSGLNIVSEFNLDNITEYAIEGKDIEEAMVDNLEEKSVQINYNLYCKFWALQDFFRNPNQCYNKVLWKTFACHTRCVLSVFSSFKLEEPGSILNKKELDNFREIDGQIRNCEYFFAKFLTNPRLLALQLSDSNFRRSVLLQFLILFQYLSSVVKFKAESYSLNELQMEFIKETETKVYELVKETPPQGGEFAKRVQHLLQREELWNNWKNEGCKEFRRPESFGETGKSSKRDKRSLGGLARDALKYKRFHLGNNEMTRLWNLCPDNLEACKGEDRNFLPSLETYLENPHEKNDPSFEWRALRLLARQSPHFFTLFNSPSYKITDYLEGVRKKIQKDKTDVRVEVHGEQIPAEPQEQESVAFEEQEDAELLKTEQLTPDNTNSRQTNTVTKEIIEVLSVKIGSGWKKLGKKLGYSEDEILYFDTEHPTQTMQCKAMLQIWFEDDADATLDNLAYILEGLDMLVAADTIKRIINAPNKVEDISD